MPRLPAHRRSRRARGRADPPALSRTGLTPEHSLRIRILEVLSAADEVPVAALLEETGLEPSHLSQHLAVLRRHRLVLSERRASHVYYRLADPRAAELLAVARALLLSMLDGDSQRLASAQDLPALPGGAA